MTTSTAKFDEIAFAKQLNCFEAAMETDLNQRNSDVGKKWEFNFETEQPALQKTFSWDEVRAVDEETRPTLQLTRSVQSKPKLSLGNFSEKSSLFKSDNANRSSLFGCQSQITDSTVAESMLDHSGSSYVASSIGKGSILDFNFGRRTSLAMNLQMRRKTEQAKESRISSDISSLNDRSSQIEEGVKNSINSAVPK